MYIKIISYFHNKILLCDNTPNNLIPVVESHELDPVTPGANAEGDAAMNTTTSLSILTASNLPQLVGSGVGSATLSLRVQVGVYFGNSCH